MEINILHLYDDILNLYGEHGNVALIKKHLEDQGFKVNLEKKTLNDEIDFERYVFVYIGSGTEKNLKYAFNDIKRYKNELNKMIEKNTVILATGNSFEMFGKKIDKEEMLNIFDFENIILEDRQVSNIIYRSNFFEGKVIGFINKMTETYHNLMPLFEVEYGIGENRRNDFEGVKYLNFYGTHVLGPVLAKNPNFLKFLVCEIGKNVKPNFEYIEKQYLYEENAYQMNLNELEKMK